MKYHSIFKIALLSALAFFFVSCKPDTESYKKGMYLNLSTDPGQLNPYNAGDAYASMINKHIFNSFMQIDMFTYQLVPVLAESAPTYEEKDGKIYLYYTIRKEAKWANGSPITSKDVEFSFKAFQCPTVDNDRIKEYYDHVENVVLDPTNPRKVTFVINKRYMLFEQTVSTLDIIPQYVYDANGLLDSFSVVDMKKEGIESNDKIVDFGLHFNGTDFQREIVSGSGPYELEKWETNQRIILKKKKNWWGDALAATNHNFKAIPERISYEIIKEPIAQVAALKSNTIDALSGIRPESYINEFKGNTEMGSKYHIGEKATFGYSYIGLNTKNPKLADVKVREALAMALDLDKFIETVLLNMAVRVHTFLPDVKKDYIAKDLKKIPFDTEKAQKLLSEAGWKDANGDGILDQSINGKSIPLELTITLSSSSENGKKLMLQYAENLKKLGIKLNIDAVAFEVMIERMKDKNFELMMMGWGSGSTESDPGQIWKSDAPDNYVGFGDANTDAIISNLRSELNAEVRKKYYHELQMAIQKEMPYIFLFTGKNGMAINKKYDNVNFTSESPGFHAPSFTIVNPE